MGYEVYIIYVDVPVSVARKRMEERYLKTGRYVAEAFINKTAQESKPTFQKIRSTVDGYILIEGQTGKIVEKGGKPFPTSML